MIRGLMFVVGVFLCASGFVVLRASTTAFQEIFSALVFIAGSVFVSAAVVADEVAKLRRELQSAAVANIAASDGPRVVAGLNELAKG